MSETVKKQKHRSIALELSVLFIGLLLMIMIAMLFMNNAYLTRFYELRLQYTLKKAYTQVDQHVDASDGVDIEYFRISKKWCSGTGQKRSPHLRACPNSISFEPSRRPSVANAFLYRESFWRAILTNQSFGVFIL